MAKRGGANDRGSFPIMGWVLIICCLTSVWQVIQLQTGHASFSLAPVRHSHLLSRNDLSSKVATALGLSLPLVSPLASKPGKLQAFDYARHMQAQQGQPLNFAANGPLDIFTAANGSDLQMSTACNDVHPNAESPSMLHVAFACDLSQIEGLMASVASVVSSAAAPEDLTIHIMVQDKLVNEFKTKFGIGERCWGIVLFAGVLIRVHAVDATLIQKSVAQVPSSVKKERGAIDSIENFARFYMHLVIDRDVVVYLDADTIVQTDLGQLRKALLKSGKTIGFVNRTPPVLMDKFLLEPKECKNKFESRWQDFMKMPAYNVGVLVLNIDRWKRFRYWERVEEMITQHNKCDGKLWIGGSQPPLLLAFMNHARDEKGDFTVFDASWNGGDLGWRHGMSAERLSKFKILHWNGNLKPWFLSGLYRGLWQPHRARFDTLVNLYHDTMVDSLRWFVTTVCTGEQGETSSSCDETCGDQGRECDYSQLHPLTSESAMRTAAAAAGYTCESFAVETKDTMEVPWDGPWIQGNVCGYHQGPVWQGGCNVKSVCGYNRICPCKAVPGMKKKSRFKKSKKKRKRRTGTTTPSPEMLAALEKCPQVRLLDSWSETPDACILGTSFGCTEDATRMWAEGQCSGMFSVGGQATVCRRIPDSSVPNHDATKHICEAGRMQTPTASCGLMLITTYFTTKKDWQRDKYARPSFSKFQKLYRTVFELGLNVTVVYDELPEDIIQRYGSDRWRWEKVSLQDYDSRYGVNDVRYFYFERLLKRHTEWRYLFVIDAFDVVVRMNPCHTLRSDKLYVGGELDKLQGHPWMEARFKKLGGKYQEWYKTKINGEMMTMNCGLTGGHREIMLRLFKEMIEIQADPDLPCRKKGQDINVNMAALNYIVYNSFKTKGFNNIITGPPFHSLYKRYQVKRKDVWFVHK